MDVEKIAKLARLKLSASEVERFGKELEAILEFAKDLESIAVAAGIDEGQAPMREDVAGPANAHAVPFAVPKVIE